MLKLNINRNLDYSLALKPLAFFVLPSRVEALIPVAFYLSLRVKF